MPPRRRKRLDPTLFDLPAEAMRAGRYSDRQFVSAREILRASGASPRVLVQVGCSGGGILGGIDEAIAILRLASDDWSELVVHALYEGDRVEPAETVLTIDGPYGSFAHLETVIVGVLARRTFLVTRTRALVEAARPRLILALSARHDLWSTQPGDGFAATVGGAKGVGTEAQAQWAAPTGTGAVAPVVVPYGLIAANGGDTAEAARRMASYAGEEAPLLVPVDYANDAVPTSVAAARALEGRLWGVLLETSEFLVDRSITPLMGTFPPTGVNPQLVWNVRNALDGEGFGEVKLIVGGAVTLERIRADADEGVPVDGYAAGASLLTGRAEFSADVVQVDGAPAGRAGRELRPNPRLERVK